MTLSLALSPNPSTGRVRLRLAGAGAGPLTVRVFDILGRQVDSFPFASGSSEQWWDASGRIGPQVRGQYLIAVEAGFRVVARQKALIMPVR